MTDATGSEPIPAGALDGIRVIELGSLVAGPFAGRLLADHGAEVIKVETPRRPDPLRDWGQAEKNGHHVFWTTHARNKQCITLDLRAPEARPILLELVRRADVVIENFRPGTLEGWGLSYETLSEHNPGLVLARISGYGQTGPRASEAGYASVAEAAAGFRHLTGYPDQPPPRVALSVGDSLAGMFAVQGVVMALLARQRSGRGQVVDVALTESVLALLESSIADYSLTGHVRQPSGTRLQGIAPSNIYRSSDDRWLVIAANQDTLFRRLATVMGQPDLADDPRFADHLARGRHQDELDELISAWAATKDADTLLATLASVGIAVGPINTVADLVEDEQLRAREMIVPHYDEALEESVLGPGVVPRLSRTPGQVRWAGAPRPGAHNDDVYGRLLGLDEEHRLRLMEKGVI